MFDELNCPNCGEKALEKEGGLGYTARFVNYAITQACNFALNATPIHVSFPDEGNLFPVPLRCKNCGCRYNYTSWDGFSKMKKRKK